MFNFSNFSYSIYHFKLLFIRLVFFIISRARLMVVDISSSTRTDTMSYEPLFRSTTHPNVKEIPVWLAEGLWLSRKSKRPDLGPLFCLAFYLLGMVQSLISAIVYACRWLVVVFVSHGTPGANMSSYGRCIQAQHLERIPRKAACSNTSEVAGPARRKYWTIESKDAPWPDGARKHEERGRILFLQGVPLSVALDAVRQFPDSIDEAMSWATAELCNPVPKSARVTPSLDTGTVHCNLWRGLAAPAQKSALKCMRGFMGGPNVTRRHKLKQRRATSNGVITSQGCLGNQAKLFPFVKYMFFAFSVVLCVGMWLLRAVIFLKLLFTLASSMICLSIPTFFLDTVVRRAAAEHLPTDKSDDDAETLLIAEKPGSFVVKGSSLHTKPTLYE